MGKNTPNQEVTVQLMKDGSNEGDPVTVKADSFVTSGAQSDYTATVPFDATDAGSYTVKATTSADPTGATSDDEVTVEKATASDVQITLSAASGQAGDGLTAPTVASAMLAGVNVSDDITGGTLKFYNDRALTSDPATINGSTAAGTYYAAYAFGASGNIAAGNSAPAVFTVMNVADENAAFAAGVAAAGVDQDGTSLTPDAEGEFSIAADGVNVRYVVPTKAVPFGATEAVDVVLQYSNPTNTTDFAKNFFSDNNGAPNVSCLSDLNTLASPGTYWVKVYQEGDTSFAHPLAVKFTVTAASLEGGQLYLVNSGNPNDVTETEFVYDGADFNGRIGYAMNGTPSGAKVTIYNAKGQEVDGTTVKAVDAGSYTAVVEGAPAGKYKGSKTTVTFQVAQLDLSKAKLLVNDVDDTAHAYSDILSGARVNGGAAGSLPEGVALAAGPVVEHGEYTATFSAKAGQSNVVNSGTAPFSFVGKLVSATDFKYGNAALSSIEDKEFDASKGEEFDLSDVKVANLKSSEYDVVLTDASGAKVQDASAPGKYTVTVTVRHGDDFAKGGKQAATFTVVKGDVAKATVVVSYKGSVYEGEQVAYTGSDIAASFGVTVKLGDDVLAEGKDYSVSFTKGGKEVSQVVDPGTYYIVVEGIGYKGYVSQSISVGKAQVTNVRVKDGVVAWTGKAVTPVIEFTTEGKWDGTKFVVADDAEWNVLPEGQYTVSYAKENGTAVKAEDLVDEGAYVVAVAPNTKAVNWAFASNAVDVASFKVAKVVGFADVAAGEWYAQYVLQAKKLGYVDGVAEGIFAPNREMTRCEFAQVVYNMATNGQGGTTEPGTTYPTKFGDVPSDSWFAKAVEWAARYGIVTGKSATEFDPYGTITREEIATMLYRYAGNGAKADLSVLDKYADASQVSGWAKEAMAWAVENGYVNGKSDTQLAPADTAKRCEIATMAVRVQPEHLSA